MKTKVQLSAQTDIPLLHFLWKWKVSTTSALCLRFFPNRSLERGYRRLRRLERAGFIQAYILGNGEGFLWGLKKPGFETIHHELPALRADGFLSENKAHDLLVVAIHLGEWLAHTEHEADMFSEQELRSLDLSVYPSWIPQSQVHRPDGYWHVRTEKGFHTIAVEAELSQKRAGDYDKARIFYDRQPGVKRVLWVVKMPSIARQIHKRMNEASKHGEKHNIIHLRDFLMGGWHSTIQLGPDSGKTISELVHHHLATTAPPVVYRKLLDIRKSPHKSKHCHIPEFGRFRDCMAISPNSAPDLPTNSQPHSLSQPINKENPSHENK